MRMPSWSMLLGRCFPIHSASARSRKRRSAAQARNVELLETRIVPAPTLTFANPVPYSTGAGPSQIAEADLGNGQPDLVVVNQGSANGNTVSVLAGNGDGTFKPAVNYTVGAGAYGAAVGDVNGDGRPDLVVSNYVGYSVSVLVGNGDGTLKPAVNYSTQYGPRQIVLADFNNDGNLDIATSNRGRNTVSVLPNLTGVPGGKLFNNNDTSSIVGVGASPTGLAALDLNNDNNADLVVCNSVANTVTVRRGNGNGSFGAAVNYTVATAPQTVAVQDLNGDGKPDLAVTCYGNGNSGSSRASILLGNGDASCTFQAANNIALPDKAFGGALRDMTGDGQSDLVAASLGYNGIQVLPGNGDGTFAAAQNFPAGTSPDSLALGDLDGNTIPDVVVTNGPLRAGNSVSVLLQTTVRPVETTPPTAQVTTAAPTIVVAAGGTNTTTITITYADTGSGVDPTTFGTSNITVDTGATVTGFAAAGNAVTYTITAPAATWATSTQGTYTVSLATTVKDLAGNAVAANTAFSLFNNSSTLWRVYNIVNTDAHVHFYTTNKLEHDALLGLINNDPIPHHPWVDSETTYTSFAMFPTNPGGANVGYVQRLYNSQTSEHYYTASLGEAQALDALSRARTPDDPASLPAFPEGSNSVHGWVWENKNQSESVTMTNSFQGYLYLPNNASDTSANNPVGPAGTTPVYRLYQLVANTAKQTGDHTLTNDPALSGLLRVQPGWTENSMVGFAPQVAVLPTPTAGGAFLAARNFATGSGPNVATFGGVNGDGNRDLIVTHNGSSENPGSTVGVLLGNGDGTFQPAVNTSVGNGAYSVAVGDFNGDNKADLVVTNNLSNSVSVLLGNGDATFAPAQNFSTGAGPRLVIVTAIDGDGTADLAVTNYTDNTVSVLLGNGNGTFKPAQNFATGRGADGLDSGFINGDGHIDLVVTNNNTNTVSLLLGNGDGTFAPAQNLTVGSYPVSVAVADVNGDGKPDLAVTNFGSFTGPTFNTGSSSESILLGNGDGTFAPAQNIPLPDQPSFTALGDLTGDGRPDLAITNFSTNSVQVLVGNGNGTFAAPQNFATGNQPKMVTSGDVNNDGRIDLAIPNGVDNTISVLLGIP